MTFGSYLPASAPLRISPRATRKSQAGRNGRHAGVPENPAGSNLLSYPNTHSLFPSLLQALITVDFEAELPIALRGHIGAWPKEVEK